MNRGIEELRLSSDNRRSLILTLLASGLLLTGFFSAIYLLEPKAVKIVNLRVTDAILATASVSAPEPDIVTVAIDETSVEKYGQWPWPRYRVARLLKKIAAGGAKSIGIDIIFPEQDRTSPRLWQKTLKDDFGYVIDTSGLPSAILDYDIYLAETLSNGPYVLGYTLLFNEKTPSSPACIMHPVTITGERGGSPSQVSQFYQADGCICNYQVLTDAVSTSGFLNGKADIDGVLRRLPLLIEYEGKLYPSFALAVLMQSLHQEVLTVKTNGSRTPRFSLADFTIPTDQHGNFLLGPVDRQTIKQVSAKNILDGETKPALFSNKIVLVGLTAAGLAQKYSTPLTSASSSLDLYRSALTALTAKLHPVRTPLFPIWETIISLLLCLLLVGCIAYLSAIPALLLCLLGVGLSWFAAATVYQHSGYLFSPLLPTLSVSLGSCLLLIVKFHHFQQQARAETGDTLLLLKSSETSLQSILKTIPDIVFRLDSSGNITFISPAIAKYLKSPEPLLGRPILDLVDPEDLDKARYRMNERRTGERATLDLEIRLLLTKDVADPAETSTYFSLSAEGIYRPNDQGSRTFLGTQGIVRDINNRKRLEQQLLQAQKMELIGNLAAGIAHDLNNILSGLVSYPDLLLLEIPKNDPLHEKIKVIQRSGKKAAIIVQDLLTLARRSVSIDEICDLNTIISDYLESAEFQLIKARHGDTTIRTDLQENLLNIKGSSVHLSKVIMNITNNGLEAMVAGGEMVIATANIYVDCQLAGYETIPEGEYVRLSVMDCGVGIPKADLKRIFEPFYSKKSMHHSGTGLGMTVIWATIKDHRGYIDIESHEGRGTTFMFYLPTTRENAVTQQRRIVLDDYIGSESILVVDDIAEQLDIAKSMLAKLGYTVHTAVSGEKAFEAIQQQPVDLVILDMVMPGGFDGLETYQKIIQLYPGQKAIITSGFSESKQVKKLLQLGAGEYIQKPYTLEKLGIAVRKELDRQTTSQK